MTLEAKNGQLLDLDQLYSKISLTRLLAKIPNARYKRLRMSKNLRLTLWYRNINSWHLMWKTAQLLYLDKLSHEISLTRLLAKIPSVRYKQLQMCKNLRLTVQPLFCVPYFRIRKQWWRVRELTKRSAMIAHQARQEDQKPPVYSLESSPPKHYYTTSKISNQKK